MRKNGFISLIGIWMLGISSLSAQGYELDEWASQPMYDPCCSDPCDCCENQIYVGAEWLYWEPSQSGLQVGYVSDAPFPSSNGGPSPNLGDITSTPSTAMGRGIRPEKKWSSGFRVYGGYYVPCSCWEIGLSYAALPTQENRLKHTITDSDDSSSSSTSSSGSTDITSTSEFITLINGFPLIGEGTQTFTNINGRWKLQFSYGDLDFAREINCGCNVSFRPHIGVRGLWVQEKYHFLASGASGSGLGAPTTSSDNSFKERINGYGIEGGLWVNWNIGCDFHLIGHFGGAILYSHYTLNTSLITLSTPSGVLNPVPTVTSEVHLRDKFWNANPMLDTFLGVLYASKMCETTFFVRAGWEQHVIFDTNQWSVNEGNLTLQGLTLGLGVAF